MRIFLDANILFSGAKSAGAVQQLLRNLMADGHHLVADDYVVTEAKRNIAAKAGLQAVRDLDELLTHVTVGKLQMGAMPTGISDWLPEKDRPVLQAAIAAGCDVLVTGDRTHFGEGYGKNYGGVTVYSPALLALTLQMGSGQSAYPSPD